MRAREGWRKGMCRAERWWVIVCTTATTLILAIDALGIKDL